MKARTRERRPVTVVECPTCGKAVPWDDRHPWRPFCSERCKLIDLGDWFEERNRIPDDPHPREHE